MYNVFFNDPKSKYAYNALRLYRNFEKLEDAIVFAKRAKNYRPEIFNNGRLVRW